MLGRRLFCANDCPVGKNPCLRSLRKRCPRRNGSAAIPGRASVRVAVAAFPSPFVRRSVSFFGGGGGDGGQRRRTFGRRVRYYVNDARARGRRRWCARDTNVARSVANTNGRTNGRACAYHPLRCIGGKGGCKKLFSLRVPRLAFARPNGIHRQTLLRRWVDVRRY